MAKSKKKIGNKTKANPELGLTGTGVDVLCIPEIESAADKYASARDERITCSETENDTQKALLEVMHANRSKLVKELDGGCSYRYGDVLVILKSSSEKVKVKAVHDDVAED